MPLYEFRCKDDSHPSQEHFTPISTRNDLRPACGACGRVMTRMPGGHGLLYFEEGRGRNVAALGDRPITSHAQERRLMRQHGLVEAGNNLPPNIAKKAPKAKAMKEYRAKDHKGRWI